jgi:hypothetical protein
MQKWLPEALSFLFRFRILHCAIKTSLLMSAPAFSKADNAG